MSQPAATKAKVSPLRLLVVDDIELVRQMVAELFVHAGYEVEEAGGADEALKLAQLVRWDGLVLDVDMPGMNGVELYARILRSSGRDHLPVLFFTGRPNDTLQMSLADAPWAQFVSKPCAGIQLLAMMKQCLQAGSGTV